MALKPNDAAPTPERATVTVRILVTDRYAKALRENGDDHDDACSEIAEAAREAFLYEGVSAAAVREVRISVPLLPAQPKTEVVADGAGVAVSPDPDTIKAILEGAKTDAARAEAEAALTRR